MILRVQDGFSSLITVVLKIATHVSHHVDLLGFGKFMCFQLQSVDKIGEEVYF